MCSRAHRVNRSCSAPPGPRRRRWRSRRCLSHPTRRCACRPAAATAASPTMSIRSACCCCAWRSAMRRLRQLDDAAILRRKLELGPTPRWRAMSGCRRSSATWCAACWRRTRTSADADLAARSGQRARTSRCRTAAAAGAAADHVAGSEVWDARSLAYALAVEPEQGLNALRSGAVEQWLRRGLGDAQLADAGGGAGAPSRAWTVAG